jgi:hypothetical protein
MQDVAFSFFLNIFNSDQGYQFFRLTRRVI